MGVDGMVASAHTLASSAGLHVLADGGNAFDAAVTVGSTLSVVEPHMSGIGGVGVGLAYLGSESKVVAIDFAGRAPKAATPSLFDDISKDTGAIAPLVPGTVAGWLALHEKYGSMDIERLLQPAIHYAENGFPVTHLTSFVISQATSRLRQFPDSASTILGASGKVPNPCSRLIMPALASSLRLISTGGADEFYRGELAQRMVLGIQARGGIISEDDFAEYKVDWKTPVEIEYRGYRVITTPPSSAGFQILQILKLMETYERSTPDHMTPDSIHLLAEATKLAITDRIAYGGDPAYITPPIETLLSKGYALAQRSRIDNIKSASLPDVRYQSDTPKDSLIPGDLSSINGETTHFAIADRDGNVVSITQTLGAFFGSGMIAGDTGIFLNNGCTWFDEEGGPNPIGPGKQVSLVLAPTHTLRGNTFHMSLGTTGGYGILNTTPQMLLNSLWYGMDIQQAIDVPRFSCSRGGKLLVEQDFPEDVLRDLSTRGHVVDKMIDPMGLGSAHGIVSDPDMGIFQGGADPRRDGAALGM